MLILPGVKAISISEKSSYAVSGTVPSARSLVMVSADLYRAGKTENYLNTTDKLEMSGADPVRVEG